VCGGWGENADALNQCARRVYEKTFIGYTQSQKLDWKAKQA